MTLQEFWDSEEKLAIHCDTEKKLKRLCEEFGKMGKRWFNGDSYFEFYDYLTYQEYTCLSNTNEYGPTSYFIDDNIKIIEFDDIDDFKSNADQVNYPSHYTDGEIEVIDLLIDLTFDKHCKMKEVQYQVDKLVCDDLIKLKEELKENIKVVINGK